MSFDHFSIPTDTSFMNGNCTHSKMILNTPVNVRDVPCTGCPKALSCGKQNTECVAMRRWYEFGNYADEDIGRLLRRPKWG